MNADGGNITSLAGFVAQSADETRQRLVHYVTDGSGKSIVGGFNTTNLIILDIEGPVPLKMLGVWLAAERANGSTTFSDVVRAHKLRLAVARQVFPNAALAVYGSPAQPRSYSGMNYSLASEGYIEACKRGLLDNATYLLAVQYFGRNTSDEAAHEQELDRTVNETLALAIQLKRSNGSAIPIVVNTKPTYSGGPLVSPYAGWVEPDTTR
jgi:hypothetical protein